MKKKLLSLMLLAGLTLWLGCEKDSFDLPQKNVQQPALQIPNDMAALFSAEELNYIETLYQKAEDQYKGEKVILPLMAQMDVFLSYSLSRENNDGKDKIDVAISGAGHWQAVSRLKYFEVQYVPDPAGFWKGEGWLRQDFYSFTDNEPALFFESRKGSEGMYGRSSEYIMTGLMDFTGGTYDFQNASGTALRKVFVDDFEYSKGKAVIFGYVILPAGVEPVWAPEMGGSGQ